MPDKAGLNLEDLEAAIEGAAQVVGIEGIEAVPGFVAADEVASVGHAADQAFAKPLYPSAAASSGAGESGADPVRMRAAADLGDKKIAALREKLATLIAAVKATEANGTWQGTTAADYRDAFLHILGTFDQQLELFAAYPRELRAYADRHEHAIDEANRAAVEAAEAAASANWNLDI